VNRPELQRSYVGVEIMDVPSGRIIFSHNGNRRFVSASIAKVLTTACAYDTFGGGYLFRTALVGYGEIRGNRLTGPLVIVPSQDPTFTLADLRNMLSSLQGRVKTIEGSVMVGSVTGGGDHFSTEWLIQDWGQDWMPASSDLVVDRNIVTGTDPSHGLPVVAAGAAEQKDALFRTLLQSYWAPAWVTYNKESNNVTVWRPDQPVTGGLCVGNPTDFNAGVARQLLKSSGIKVEGHEVAPSNEQILFAEHHSDPISGIIRYCLAKSDNLYAQQFLRLLGTQQPINKAMGEMTLEERGLAKLNGWLLSIGGRQGDAVMFDGCGLSRKNAISPHALNVVLRHMCGPTGDGPYIDLMKHEGEGSAKTFRFKTGAMDSVRSITGIVKTSTGQPMAVTAIVNDHTPQIGELRVSLNALISQLQSLGSVKLKPLSPPVHAPGAHAPTTTWAHHRRRHR